MSTTLATLPCLACGSNESHELGKWDHMPLSILGLPRTRDEALGQANLVLDVRRCAACGHVFHTQFDPAEVSYESGSNLVWNQGRRWRRWQDELARDWVGRFALEGRTVVEVGPGDGGFAGRLARSGCRMIGFEPGPDAERAGARGIDVRASYFGRSDVQEIQPDAIVCRHVIEHMADPAAFLRDVRLGALEAGILPHFFAEVPRIDKALERRRINDFLYEHVSHFTEHSFRVLFERSGWGVVETKSGFDDEVVTLVAVPRHRTGARASALDRGLLARASTEFRSSVDRQTRAVNQALHEWREAGRRVALWGATGKGAALINMCGLDAEIAPLVVDSDPRKQGAFVPGTGQRIESPEACRREGVDLILICTQWRARDIEHEIRRVRGFRCEVWIQHDESVVPLTRDLEL